MAIRIKARGGESTEQMLRRFKKLCEKEGLVKDIKRREFYEKPSERQRRDSRKSVARRVREAGGGLPIGPREAGSGGGGRGCSGGPERSFGGGGGGGRRD